MCLLCVPLSGLLKQLVVAALSNTGKVYTTVEGAAKTHVDGAISAKASILEGVLGELTGPAWGVLLTQANNHCHDDVHCD